jgi:hypothetical protein
VTFVLHAALLSPPAQIFQLSGTPGYGDLLAPRRQEHKAKSEIRSSKSETNWQLNKSKIGKSPNAESDLGLFGIFGISII